MTPRFKMTKTMFFDRAMVKKMAGAAHGVLARFGAFVRRRSRSSLKPARQKTFSEMTDEERTAYERAVRLAANFGRKKPRRPEVVSKAGEVPKLHKNGARSPLKTKIEFVFDPREIATLIGPEASEESRGDVTEALEHGGTTLTRTRGSRHRNRISARPFMRPAFDKELPNLQKWKNTFK